MTERDAAHASLGQGTGRRRGTDRARSFGGGTLVCGSSFGRPFAVTPEGDTVGGSAMPRFAEDPEGGARRSAGGPQASALRVRRRDQDLIQWL